MSNPGTYTVTCSPALMTEAELRRAVARAWNGYYCSIDAETAETYKRTYQELCNERDRRKLHI